MFNGTGSRTVEIVTLEVTDPETAVHYLGYVYNYVKDELDRKDPEGFGPLAISLTKLKALLIELGADENLL